MKWAVAVTTAPRKVCTLVPCLESVTNCGWEPVVFAEPESTATDYPTYSSDTRLGVWHNWLKSCRWALEQDADLVMTVQDDALFHPDSKSFVESLHGILNDPSLGYLSLYTPKHYQHWKSGAQRPFGVYEVKAKSIWGAMAFVFKPQTLHELVNHPRAKGWLGAVIKTKSKWNEIKEQRRINPHLIQNSDTAIGRILTKHMKRRLMYVSPSPVDHCSSHSSIGHGGNRGNRNAFFLADHSLPLDFQVPICQQR